MLDAAAQAFAAEGFETTTLDDVAAAAGLTKGAIYSSFSGKDELILALMEKHVAERIRAAAAAFADASDAGDGMKDAGARLIEAVHADSEWQRLFIEYWSRAMRDPRMRVELAERRRELRKLVARAIERAARDGSLSLAAPPEELAVVVLALSNGLAIEGLIDAEAVPPDLFGRLLARLTRPNG